MGLKGNLIVTVTTATIISTAILLTTATAAAAITTAAAAALLTTTTAIAATATATIAVATSVTASTKKLDFVSHNFGVVSVFSVAILPFTGLDSALNKQLLSFLAILANVLGLTPKNHDRMPLCLLGPIAITIFSSVRRRQAQSGDRRAASRGAKFRVLAQTTNKYGFVYCHDVSKFTTGTLVSQPISLTRC
jgi:hypothetical protein